MTIIEIAKLANTSVATVSRVMNSDPHVSASTRARVQKVIDDNKFTPNYMGRNLRRNRSKRVLVVLPTIATPAYAELVQGINNKADEFGYTVMFMVSNRNPDKEKEYLKLLETRSFAGVILVATTLNDDVIEELSNGFAVVACNSKLTNPHLSYATIDNRQATYYTTKRLIDSGHRHIAIIRYCRQIKNQDEREAGYRDAMNEAGLPISTGNILCDNIDRDLDEQLDDLFSLDESPTAIISFADLSAISALKYANEHGIRIGTDVKIIGFGNVDYAVYGVPNLSVLSIPWYELGEASLDLLLEQINNPNTKAKGIIIPYELVPGKASASFGVDTPLDKNRKKRNLCQI